MTVYERLVKMRFYHENAENSFPTLNEQLEKEEFFNFDPTYGKEASFFRIIKYQPGRAYHPKYNQYTQVADLKEFLLKYYPEHDPIVVMI